ncbi:MAG TPA: hypothetical protein GX733_07480 [Tissierellia bacterium]|nr:hypothetical protein [Tissierellia bacterium]
MSKIVLYAIGAFGVIVLLYYIFMILSGKRFARLVKTKDRFIWNGLKNVSDPSSAYAGKTNTLFLDPGHLVISPLSIVQISGQIRKTGAIEEALVIPYDKIASFDFNSTLQDSNVVVRVLAFLFNRFFKVNNYHLTLHYIDDRDEMNEMKFRARNMDARDFELAFADFDNRIYTGRKISAHEERKSRRKSRLADPESPTLPPGEIEFSLADEEVSVLEQTIYMPHDEIAEPSIVEDFESTVVSPAPLEDLKESSEETVVLHQPPVFTDEPADMEPPQAPEVEIFTLDEEELEQTVAVPLEGSTRDKMRAFIQDRKNKDEV